MFKRRQVRIPQEIESQSKKEAFDVDTYVSKQTTTVQYWIPEPNLTVQDRNILLNPLGWLTDNIVNAAQNLLKSTCPAVPGLQDVTKGITLSHDVEGGRFVQILNNQRWHWLTISTALLTHLIPVSMCMIVCSDQLVHVLRHKSLHYCTPKLRKSC